VRVRIGIKPIRQIAHPRDMLATTDILHPTVNSHSAPDCDHLLVQRAAAGDAQAFEALYRRHVRRVFGAIWRLVGGVEARAEELTQDAFLRAWQALPQFRGDSAFGTWLHRLAINTALMNLRSRTGGEARETDDAVLERHVGSTCQGEMAIDLERAVAALPPRARAVLVLFDIEGWTHEEIADELGMAVGSSKAQLHRARGLLRTRLSVS
jgi:RNA polymerase sigma factor (sigma-70 family)